MEFWQNWGFWAFVVSCLVGIFNWFSHIKITTNDLHHVELDLTTLKQESKETKETLIKISNDLSYLRGKQDNSDAIVKVLQKSLNR